MQWLDSLASFVSSIVSAVLTNVVVAAIILLLGFIIGRVAGNLSKRLLGEIGMNRFIYNFIGLRFSVEDSASAFIEYFTYFATIVLALNQLRVGEIVFNAIAFFIIFFLMFSIFLSLRDFFPNLVASVLINSRQIVRKGDHVRIDGLEGTVVEMNFHSVKLKVGKKEEVIIPNRTVLKSMVVHVNRAAALDEH